MAVNKCFKNHLRVVLKWFDDNSDEVINIIRIKKIMLNDTRKHGMCLCFKSVF